MWSIYNHAFLRGEASRALHGASRGYIFDSSPVLQRSSLANNLSLLRLDVPESTLRNHLDLKFEGLVHIQSSQPPHNACRPSSDLPPHECILLPKAAGVRKGDPCARDAGVANLIVLPGHDLLRS